MKNTIRCCISCILPCGSLDVIRIVHSNGHVEEISGTIKAIDIMRAHPKHVLKKPSSTSSADDATFTTSAARIVIVPPEADLQRGKIYFLMPAPPSNDSNSNGKSRSKSGKKKTDNRHNHHHRHQRRDRDGNGGGSEVGSNSDNVSETSVLISDRYMDEILSEKIATQRDRRRGRVGVWRPHLESISETPVDV